MPIISQSPAETIKIGRQIARYLKPADIICLFGELGSGKTALTQGLAQGLGINRGRVSSPSFVLIREYAGKEFPLYHFDFYRIKSAQQILDLGYQDYLYGAGVTVMEWSQRMKYLLPAEYLGVELHIKSGSQRWLKFSARGRRYRQLLQKINENIRH